MSGKGVHVCVSYRYFPLSTHLSGPSNTFALCMRALMQAADAAEFWQCHAVLKQLYLEGVGQATYIYYVLHVDIYSVCLCSFAWEE